MATKIYKTSAKSNNIHVVLDCVDYLLVELLKLEEAQLKKLQNLLI